MADLKEEDTPKVKFEEVLLALGGLGLYQKRLLCLVCLTSALVLMHNMSPVFTMKIPDHRCKIPGYDNDTYAIQDEFHFMLINRSIPLTSTGDFSKCTVYGVSSNHTSSPHNTTERECSEWVYDQSEFSSTLVTQLNLVCGRQLFRSHSNMVIFAGKFAGAFLSSMFGDYFGRRGVYTLMMLVMAGTSVGLVFTFNLPLLMIFRFLIGASTTGSYLCTYVIGMELLGKKHRSLASTATNLFGVFGTIVATLIAYLTRDWQYFQAGLAALCLPVIIGYFFIPESPRWLVSKGRHKEAQKTIDAIARVNGVSLPKTMQVELLKAIDQAVPKTSKSKTVSPLELFRRPRLFVRYTLVYLSWIFLMMCMYGLMLNVSNMSGDVFLNFTLLCIVDLLSVGFFALLVDRAGRRILLVGVTALGGVACTATILPVLLGGSSWILRGLSLAGRFCIRSAITTMYIMSPELFPTVFRSFGLGSCSMMSRLGALASPYVADLNTFITGGWGPALPQIVFGVTGLVTSFMALFQPETKGRNLPETVDDADRFGRKPEDTSTSPEDEELMRLPPAKVSS